MNPHAVKRGLFGYAWFFRSMMRYARMEGSEPIRLANVYPQLHDRVEKSPYDAHYFFQDNWALRRVIENRPPVHVDVGSRVDTVSHIAAFTDTVFVDIRPLEARVGGLHPLGGNILQLPFADRSIPSLSCLNVAEHIGLGRYGDPLDPQGTRKAARELARVLAPGGNLYFSLPIGEPRLCFNAHRVHDTKTILEYFHGLQLVELSAIDDDAKFVRHLPVDGLDGAYNACGLFWFRRPPS